VDPNWGGYTGEQWGVPQFLSLGGPTVGVKNYVPTGAVDQYVTRKVGHQGGSHGWVPEVVQQGVTQRGIHKGGPPKE
jgi:hypothetical protein